MKKEFLKLIIITIIVIPTLAHAEPPTPPGGSGPMAQPGGSSSTVASYSGNTTISSATTEENKTYTSTTGGENALLVTGGTSSLSNPTITKSGDSDGDSADFYGTNAAILTYNGATLNITGGTITTNGSHANGAFSYGTGTINITNTKINTTGNNSGGVMVTGGGTLNATNLTVKTTGNSSASIRSDRGGGNLSVNKGTYETSGVGSPSIYSTANIVVNNATLISTKSEGIVVEGANSVSLNKVELTDTNNTLNGNSETYKNIFLYQSMSGDADTGTASFTSKNSKIITNKGDTIFVTNTTATINLENNTITNNDGDFLRIQTGKWGNSGSNGGNVTLKMTNQKIEGDIIVDSISTLDLTMSDGSVFTGAFDNKHQASKLNVKLSSDSIISLTADSYISSLTNEITDNSNIYLNGHKLYVNNKEISANEATYDGATTKTNTTITTNITNKDHNYIYYIIAGVLVVSIIVVVILIIKKRKNKITQ
ncbi:MAG: hypothetical protein IKO49_05885 [Bacilli bacterium]|nr:hypothetical protein [Bacilli bacterium]